MFIKNFIALSMLLSFNLIGDESSEQSFPGLVSTEVFNMGNGMEMHIERRKTYHIFLYIPKLGRFKTHYFRGERKFLK